MKEKKVNKLVSIGLPADAYEALKIHSIDTAQAVSSIVRRWVIEKIREIKE